MTPLEERKVVSILDRALNSPVGVGVELLNADAARIWRQRIYEVRKRMPQFRDLILIPREETIYLVKNPGDWEDDRED